METVIEVAEESQSCRSITPADRRLLLGASLRLLSHRFSSGKPILQDDVTRVALLADDVVERAA